MSSRHDPVIIKNPLAEIGLNREVIARLYHDELQEGLPPTEAQGLRSRVLKVAGTLYAARLKLELPAGKDPKDLSPDQVGRLRRLDAAMQDLKDPQKFARILEDYRPMTPDEEVAHARQKVFILRERLKELGARGLRFMVDLCSHDIPTVKNCGPGRFTLVNEADAAVFRETFPTLAQTREWPKYEQVLFESRLAVTAGGVVKDEKDSASKRLVCCLEIPKELTLEDVLDFAELNYGAATPLLEMQGQPPGPDARGRRYNLTAIPSECFERLTPYISARIVPEDGSARLYLMSCHTQKDSGARCYSLEGRIVNYQSGESTNPKRVKPKAPKPDKTPEKKKTASRQKDTAVKKSGGKQKDTAKQKDASESKKEPKRAPRKK